MEITFREIHVLEGTSTQLQNIVGSWKELSTLQLEMTGHYVKV